MGSGCARAQKLKPNKKKQKPSQFLYNPVKNDNSPPQPVTQPVQLNNDIKSKLSTQHGPIQSQVNPSSQAYGNKYQDQEQKKIASLKIATLNYSGILLSPFEFYSQQGNKTEQGLNSIILEELKMWKGENAAQHKWEVGQIDKRINDRYTPIYNKQAGIQVFDIQEEQAQCIFCNFLPQPKVNKKEQSKNASPSLISRGLFKTLWDQKLKQSLQKQKILPKTQEKNQMFEFDFMCYRAIVRYVYKLDSKFNFNSSKSLSQLNVKKYKKFLQKMHMKSFVREQQKMNKTLAAFKKEDYDVIFLQQIRENIYQKLLNSNQYKVFRAKDKHEQSIIILKKKSFEGQEIQIQKQDWNKDSEVIVTKNYVLASVHLSSKKENNESQVIEFNSDLQNLAKKYKDKIIVVGGDFNSQMIYKQSSRFKIFPRTYGVFTVYKKRTHMQVQLNKAGVVVKEAKDYVITNGYLYNEQIKMIDGKGASDKVFLPNQQHPYDHFLVEAVVRSKK